MIEHVLTGGAPAPGGAFPVATFQTSDGSINVSVIKDHLWPLFCTMIGHPRLGDDPNLKTGYQRRERAEEILRLAGEAFAKNTSDYWCAKMRELGILHEKVNGYDELFQHEQTKTMHVFPISSP